MKTKIFTLGFAFMIFSSFAYSAESVYTSMALLGKGSLYASVKVKEKGAELDSYLMVFSPEKMTSQKVKLPNDIDHREVVALIPAQTDKLLVMTQQTLEKGDGPLVHLFDPVKKTWKKVGQSDCISFNKILLAKSKLVLACEMTDEKGEAKFIDKEVVLKGATPLSQGDFPMPLAKIEEKEVKAQFNGLPYEWESLKLTFKGKEKVFKPE